MQVQVTLKSFQYDVKYLRKLNNAIFDLQFASKNVQVINVIQIYIHSI